MSKIVITGAADGIGKALAAAYAAAGHDVIGVDVDVDRAAQTQSEIGERLSFVIADLSDADEVQRTADEIGDRVDVVIHNAGINEVGYFADTNPARQQKVIAINLTAPMLLTRHLLASGTLAGTGSVVFVSSLSRYVSYPGASVYAATKDGLASYARSLSVEYPQMHVLTVYPGPTRTEHARRYSPDNSKEDKRMTPEDLAARIVRAVDDRQRVLIPGAANWIFAILGRVAPALTDYAMKKTLLEKFEKPAEACE
ncbi:MAG: SDR family NAD(P)-dependent oxidoreductase, partial [Chloroflexota bacterium]